MDGQNHASEPALDSDEGVAGRFQIRDYVLTGKFYTQRQQMPLDFLDKFFGNIGARFRTFRALNAGNQRLAIIPPYGTDIRIQSIDGSPPIHTVKARLTLENSIPHDVHIDVLKNLQDLISFVLACRGAPPEGYEHSPSPYAAFFSTLHLPNAAPGNAAYTPEALDHLISQLMEQDQSSEAPGPASAEAIAKLPKAPFEEGNARGWQHVKGGVFGLLR